MKVTDELYYNYFTMVSLINLLLAQTLAEARYDPLLRTTPELLISGSDDHMLFLWSSPSSSGPWVKF